MATTERKYYRADYLLDGIYWRVQQRATGFMCLKDSATMGGPYPDQKAAEQNMFVFMREHLGRKRDAAMASFVYAIQMQERIGSDWASGLQRLKL